MTLRQFVLRAAPAAAFVGTLIAGLSIQSRAKADDRDHDRDDESKIQIGFAIAPVPLTVHGKNRELVGLGSYIVNAQADCNGCHNGGGPPNFNYAPGGNPYLGQRPKVDPTVYLSGGADFGQVGPPFNPGPHIFARNLTPDKTGLPEGGHTLAEFRQIIRHGRDYDKIHPTCKTPTVPNVPPNCIPFVDGDLLQIMPWPAFANMTDHDIDAIYEYLSAIPCLEGSPDPKSILHNDCH